jgi:hypothetical protein
MTDPISPKLKDQNEPPSPPNLRRSPPPPHPKAIRGACRSSRVKKNRKVSDFFRRLCRFDAEVGVTDAGKLAGRGSEKVVDS